MKIILSSYYRGVRAFEKGFTFGGGYTFMKNSK